MQQQCSKKRIRPGQILNGKKIFLRLVTLEDCKQEYLNWLNDPEVNRYLETRWHKQTLSSVQEFVLSMLEDPDNYLFAINHSVRNHHIGNIKLGPINHNHSYADISYFIGEKNEWGKGYASEAIHLVSEFGFNRLNLHRLQAGLYRGNIASASALVKAGFQQDGCFKKQLRGSEGWEDHIWYCKIQ